MFGRARREPRSASMRVEAEPVTVAITPDGDAVGERLRRIAGRRRTFMLVEPDAETRAEVLVVAVDDVSVVAELRRVRRSPRPPRTVVIATGVDRFEAAFDAGADAWIDRTADDGTVEAAILGRWR